MANRGFRPGRANRSIKLPRFNSALGEFLALPSHLEQKYSDVITQVYPLKADAVQLQTFCDSYLNLSGSPPVHFEAPVPWVFMQVVDYGKMASTSRNVGWFSQHELAFGVPVRTYKKEKGKWRFADWALVFPFIFVNNPLSMSAGREIYGWSKAEIRIDTIPSIFEPGHLRNLASISLVTSGSGYGEKASEMEFLRIVQQRPFISLRSAVTDVLTAIPRVIASSISAASSFLATSSSFAAGSAGEIESLQEALVRFYGPQLNVLAAETSKAATELSKTTSGPSSQVNIVTLKQVRDVRSLSAACFQGLVRSTMTVDRVIDGGYLFDPLTGDATGGILINLLETEVQPIVNALGINVTGDTVLEGKRAAAIAPLLPFWLKMDLGYGLADYQCWRTETTEWTIGERIGHLPRRTISYISMGSGAGDEIGGRRHFPDITFRVMPLRADKNKLRRVIDQYLKNDFFGFELAGRIEDDDGVHAVICLVGSNFEKMTARSTPGTTFSDRELSFVAPVLWWEKRKPRKKYCGVVPLYTFAGAAWNVATSYEVYGQLALRSKLIGQETEWLCDPTRADPTLLLAVSTELFPKPAKSQEAQELPVVEVFSSSSAQRNVSLADYLFQLGLSHLWKGDRFQSIDLKQIVDAADPVYVDYQALITIESKFQKRSTRNGAIAPVSVKVFDYPTFPIVGTLGLTWDNCDKSGPHPVYTLRPTDPFWISGAMNSDAGREMCWRVGTDWQKNPDFIVP